MYRNYAYMMSLHDARISELNRIENRVKREKDAWAMERSQIGGLVKSEDEIIKLDVGGARLKVSQDTLCQVPGSLLAKMFSGKHESLKVGGNDVVYLDRDFKVFDAMIKYLRNNRKVYPNFDNPSEAEAFAQELEYWGIKTFNDDLEEKRLRMKLPSALIDFLESEPFKAHEGAKKKWQQLGPIKLRSIEKFSYYPDIDFDLKFGHSKKYANFSGQMNLDNDIHGIGRYIVNGGTIYEGQILKY